MQVHVAIKALNEVHSSVHPDSSRRGRGLDRASALAMSMRHFLGAYLANVMGHLVHSSASALQQVSPQEVLPLPESLSVSGTILRDLATLR